MSKKDKSIEQVNWHSLSIDQVVDKLRVDQNGLVDQEAQQRLRTYGANRLPPTKTRGPLLRFLAQFHNLLIYVLIGAAVVTALLDHWVDTYVIIAVVLVNSIIGFVQEGKAEKALEAIRHMLAPRATVLRNGHRIGIPAENLVPGDIVMLEPGDKVPADLRLLSAKGLQIQEAVLTGESVAVEKSAEAVEANVALGDRFSMAYSGTLVAAGHGKAVVVATGGKTEIGRISGMISSIEAITTPLLKQISVFSRWLTMAILLIAGSVFAFGFYVQGADPSVMFMTVVGLAVAAIPEGLPAILTVTLAIGVQRMASRNAIIRRLPAVETLGAVSIIASDKTGTLTRNEMTVKSIVTSAKLYEISGVGYEPSGDFFSGGEHVAIAKRPILQLIVKMGALCNDSSLQQKGGLWIADGDPMEGALLAAAIKAGLDPADLQRQNARTDVIPFDAQHRFMATLNHDHKGHDFIIVKGAPERLIELCTLQRQQEDDVPINPAHWAGWIDQIASLGQRVLAIAYKPVEAGKTELNFSDLNDGLILLGLIGLIDPPRDEAIQAVEECRAAGIRVKMITGDHAATARAIAAQLHLKNHDDVLTGHELSEIGDDELIEVAARVDIFARTSPEHKLRLVTALQAGGKVVAMTGDGVNDAPALKRADVGIAMGRTGTEAAKEAAEMVLADDNFASIARAVREGRTVYDNLKKSILFLLPVNGGESMSIIATVLAGLTLPITPLQILWVNMVSSVALAMALAFEPSEPSIMQRRPRRKDESMLSGFLLWRISFVSLLFFAGIYGIFLWSQLHGSTLEEGRTYAVNTLVILEVFYLLNVRYLSGSSLSLRHLFGSKAVLIAIAVVITLQAIFTYAPFMEDFFDTRPIDFIHGLEIFGIGLALFFILELEKLIRRWLS
ncbi:cation-transporting P-type ATPase [Methylomarinum sp. Ch1-1]|uniref:Cation-transporting P-type ATPase n=1 Tax=Methylomarinum roseum TaxID=3067653 RepID=A0AAU7NX98_9GAMM|nr:cation-transporting P-type ATPase [Methylomarinum sp. Ch1-1]MDP4522306.1 cation-transporting P-type ATPase [Methylomarinum sp. Ch1-1]